MHKIALKTQEKLEFESRSKCKTDLGGEYDSAKGSNNGFDLGNVPESFFIHIGCSIFFFFFFFFFLCNNFCVK